MYPELRPVVCVQPPAPATRATAWPGGAADVTASLQAVLTGEVLGEGPWLTNVLFRALQTSAHARGAVRAAAPRRPVED